MAPKRPCPCAICPRVTTRAFPALMMPVILLYGIYGGITTPTEAAAIAAAYALVVSVLLYRALKLRTLYTILVDRARASAAVGIDLVHFGVVVVVNCMIGLITPPYGILLFVINAVTGIPLREVLPFLAVLVAALAALIFLPGIVLFLPRLFGYEG